MTSFVDRINEKNIAILTIITGWMTTVLLSVGPFLAARIIPLKAWFEEFPSRLIGLTENVRNLEILYVSTKDLGSFWITAGFSLILFLAYLLYSISVLIRAVKKGAFRRGLHLEGTTFVLKNIFEKGFYRLLAERLDYRFSWFTIRILLRIGELVGDYPWFDLEHCRRMTWDISGRFSRRIMPVSHFFDRFIQLFTRSGSGEVTSRLMDEGRVSEYLEGIPENLIRSLNRPPSMDELLISDEWSSVLNNAVIRWEKGLVSGLLIKGGSGSGKSLLIESILSGKGVGRNIRLTHSDGENSVSAFIDNILETRIEQISQWEREIIVIDDFECLMKRKIGGFDSLRSCCRAIEKTKDKYLWIVSCNPVFYEFISSFLPLKSIFQNVLEITPPPATQVAGWFSEKLLKETGIHMDIIPDKVLNKATEKKIRHKELSETEREGYIAEQYFRRLLDHGGMNYYFIRFFLLRSVQRNTAGEISFTIPAFLDIPLIKDLKLDEHFVLTSLYFHGWMSKEDLSEVLPDMTESHLSLTISLLYENNLIAKEGDRFRISPLVYQPLLRFYRQRKMAG